jgi:16S rRNA processing protein RimM
MGRVAAPHGVRGALKIKPLSAAPDALLHYKTWWLRLRDGDFAAYRVRSAREHGDSLVAELAGLESREAAFALRGAEIAVPREALPQPGNDEYYQGDLIGIHVVNREGVELGLLQDFVESGAHPIARVVDAAGVERLIPWVDAYIDGVDAAERRMDVDWPAET